MGLRWISLTNDEGPAEKWIPDFNLEWVAFGQTVALSKTTKLILLDSLLQEVCITARISVLLSHNPPLYAGLMIVH